MAGFDYGKAQRTADTIIRKFAAREQNVPANDVVPGTLVIPTTTGGSTLSPGAHGTTPVPIIMVIVDYEQRDRDSTIQLKDRRVMISPLDPDGAPLSPAPTTAHRIILPGQTGPAYEIVRVKPLDPAGVDVFCDLQVRSG